MGSKVTLEAPTPQRLGGSSYAFASWSDGGAQRHVVTVPGTARTYTATYRRTGTAPVVQPLSPDPKSKVGDRTPTARASVRDGETDLAKSNIRFYLDGKRRKIFSYDRTADRLTYAPRSRLAPRTHTVKVVANDGAGNVTVRRWSFRVRD